MGNAIRKCGNCLSCGALCDSAGSGDENRGQSGRSAKYATAPVVRRLGGGEAGGGEAGGGAAVAPPSPTLDLRSATNDVPLFSLEGWVVPCKVVNVYDGDTCKIVLELDGRLAKFNCRMAGYDTPEMRPPRDKPDRDKEIAAAKAAKARLIELVMSGGEEGDQLVTVECGEFDKYGRLLTTLYVNAGDTKSVNQMLVDEGHGYEYDGGTKKAFSQ